MEMSEENIFREELRRMMLKLKGENDALLKLIRELNSQADDIISVSRPEKVKQNKPKTIKP